MSSRDLAEFSALTFDCYGTLIDWETGIWDALQPLLMANPGCEVDRTRALAAFGEAETAEQTAHPETLYPGILAGVHRAIAARFDLDTDAALDEAFGASVQHWPAFPDTAGALRRLKTRYRLVILSNVDRAGIAASNRKLGVELDAIYTAQDIGSYKPDPRNFAYMIERLAGLGIEAGEILHTAQSLHHDHVPARDRRARQCLDRPSGAVRRRRLGRDRAGRRHAGVRLHLSDAGGDGRRGRSMSRP